jgi:hypothetical protein
LAWICGRGKHQQFEFVDKRMLAIEVPCVWFPLDHFVSGPFPSWSFLEPIVWLEHAKAGRPRSSELCFHLPVVIGRRRQRERLGYRDRYDRADAMRKAAA